MGLVVNDNKHNYYIFIYAAWLTEGDYSAFKGKTAAQVYKELIENLFPQFISLFFLSMHLQVGFLQNLFRDLSSTITAMKEDSELIK